MPWLEDLDRHQLRNKLYSAIGSVPGQRYYTKFYISMLENIKKDYYA